MANDITIDIGARNKATKVLDEVRRDIGVFGKRVKSVTQSMKGMFSVIATAGASVAGLRSISLEMQRIDEIAKTSRKLGLFTEELVGLRLAAAEFSGMADRQLDTALQRMTRRLSEAADKTKTASLTMDGSVVQLSGVRKVIDDLGLSAERLNAVGPALAFREIADAIKEVKNPADQLRIAFTLFDSEGASLVNTLTQGSEAIDQMQVKAESLGMTFTDLAANRIEAANDKLHELGKTLEGLKTELVIGLAPEIETTSNLAIDFVRTVGPMLRGMQQDEIAKLLRPFQYILPRTIGANGYEDSLTNAIQEASGIPEAGRLNQMRRELVTERRRIAAAQSEWDSIISGAIADTRNGDPLGFRVQPSKTDKGTPRLSGNDERERYRQERLDALFDKKERFYDIRNSGLRQDSELYAKESRIKSGAGETRRNPVVESVQKLSREFAGHKIMVERKFDALIGRVGDVVDAQPEFERASVEVIEY